MRRGDHGGELVATSPRARSGRASARRARAVVGTPSSVRSCPSSSRHDHRRAHFGQLAVPSFHRCFRGQRRAGTGICCTRPLAFARSAERPSPSLSAPGTALVDVTREETEKGRTCKIQSKGLANRAPSHAVEVANPARVSDASFCPGGPCRTRDTARRPRGRPGVARGGLCFWALAARAFCSAFAFFFFGPLRLAGLFLAALGG